MLPPEKLTLPQAAGQVLTVSASAINAVPIRWLWPHWLARGKLHLLAGDPGQGKTTLALAFAAAVSAGGRWPDGSRLQPGNVLIYSAEDDTADTLKPRLIAAGADLKRVHFIRATRRAAEELEFDPARDIEAVRALIEQLGGVDLFIIDPLVAALRGGGHSNSATRRDLQPLVTLAATMGCAILGITHLTKGSRKADPMLRINGSIAFSAVVRVVMIADRILEPDGKLTHALLRVKGNNGPEDGGYKYRIEFDRDVAPGIDATRTVWGEPVHGTARELLADAQKPTDPDAVRLRALLRQKLEAGPAPAAEVKREMSEAGFSRRQIEKAAEALGVKHEKTGMKGGWCWRLADPLMLEGNDPAGASTPGRTGIDAEPWPFVRPAEPKKTEGVEDTHRARRVSSAPSLRPRRSSCPRMTAIDESQAELFPELANAAQGLSVNR